VSKDYKNIKQKKHIRFSQRFSGVLSFLTGLSLGLFITVIVYFHGQSRSIEKNKSLLNNGPVDNNSSVTANKEGDIAQIPEPQFDFYNILSNRKVNISEWDSAEDDPESKQTDNPPSEHVLQVGSFKQFRAADEIKAKLAMVGVTADIQRVVINGQDVLYRVRVGPYKDTIKLQKARNRLLDNGIDFISLKLRMKDI
jgi:cell division protein FtsN